MKISLISGISKRQVTTSGPSNLIGSLDWAERAGIPLSSGEKLLIRAKQSGALRITARGIILELIDGNRGGLADMLYGMSGFNTEGKIDQGIKSQYDAAIAELKRTADIKFPTKKLTLQQWLALPTKPRDKALKPILEVQDSNYVKNREFVTAGLPDINKKFPYLIYPPSTEASRKKYRELEIYWTKEGGNVDQLNDKVKNGITKSPRNKTFNYLLGKFASGTFKTKDVGLAARAMIGAALGGDRFSYKDSDIFNPWKKQLGSQKIGKTGMNGADPVSLTALLGSSAYWGPIISNFCTLLLTGLATVLIAWAAGALNPEPEVAGTNDPGKGNGGNGDGDSDLSGMLLPVGAAVAAYFLLFSDDK